jgi:hypothetical protein
MAKDTGGSAFPLPEHLFNIVQDYVEKSNLPKEISEQFLADFSKGAIGMTLRDYFAAKAMQGIAANQRWNVTKQIDNCAREAYAIADAMIKERNKQ